MPSLPVELTRRAVLDGDLDMTVDLGKAVARAPMPTPRSKLRPILPDFLSLVYDATSIPPIELRQPAGTEHALINPSPPLPSPTTVEPSSCQAVMVKKRTVPPQAHPRQRRSQNRKSIPRRKWFGTMKSTTYFVILWWLDRHVGTYQHPFCELRGSWK
ncbi:hypothetical protein BJV78DRAFT_857457 [Lactifluus subvellereus]|nr:hypothetical protein BJV78DRAFT_857457 [Lactifluus subvellereus]